jgi:hypothetical protein
MSSTSDALHAANSASVRQPGDGLDVDELRAEQAASLPEREAMSILDVGGIGAGLPPPEYLDGVLDVDVSVGTLPVDGPPVEQVPIDQLPIDRLPVEPFPLDDVPVQPLPTDPSVAGEPIGVPNPEVLRAEPGTLA